MLCIIIQEGSISSHIKYDNCYNELQQEMNLVKGKLLLAFRYQFVMLIIIHKKINMNIHKLDVETIY